MKPPSVLVQKAACHLQPHVFDKFREWVEKEHDNEVFNSAHLQGLLVQFLRLHKQQTQNHSPCAENAAVLIALREAGATGEDIAILAQTSDFATLTVCDALKRYHAL